MNGNGNGKWEKRLKYLQCKKQIHEMKISLKWIKICASTQRKKRNRIKCNDFVEKWIKSYQMINRRSLRHWRVDLFELFWLDGKSAKNGNWLWLRWILLAHLYVIFAFIHLMFYIMVLWIMSSRWMLFFDTKNSNDTASPSDQCITYINPYFVLLLLLSRLFHSNFYRFLLHVTMKHKCCYCTKWKHHFQMMWQRNEEKEEPNEIA